MANGFAQVAAKSQVRRFFRIQLLFNSRSKTKSQSYVWPIETGKQSMSQSQQEHNNTPEPIIAKQICATGVKRGKAYFNTLIG